MRGCRWTQLLRCSSRWSAVALAAFYLNFLVVHLATETHFHTHEHAHATDSEHDHGSDGHAPHDATEHLVDVAFKAADLLHAPVLAIVSESFILNAPALFTWTRPVFERERPPGDSPPDPQQPRAPPLA